MLPSRPPAPAGAVSGRLAAWLDLPQSAAPSAAADGEDVLYLGNASGLPQVWQAPISGGPSRQLVVNPERVGAVQAAPVGTTAVLAIDAGGNEHWQLQLLDTGRPREPLRGIAMNPDVIHLAGAWSEDALRYRFSSNARDRRFFDVHEADVRTGLSTTLISGDAMHSVRAVLGNRTLIVRNNTNLDSDLLVLDGERTVHLTPHDQELTIFSASLGRDGVFAGANPGRELSALVRYRPGGGGHEFLAEYPGDVELVESSPDGERLAVVVNRDGWSEAHVFEVGTREDRVLNSGPKGVIANVSWLPDSSAYVYDLSSVDGVDLYRRAIATGKEKRLTGIGRAPPTPVAPPRLSRMRASDGVAVPYWEYAPAGAARGTLLWVHGGPEAQARPQFGPVLEFLVAEGWRVIAPNIRGSTGYGRTFVHLDDVRRRMDAIRDVKELADELVRAGKATAGRIGIVGGSYGGFVVLSAASTHPELWGAAIDVVGIANWVTFLERTGAWRRRLREVEYGSLETDRAFLEEISPLRHADAIRAPLFVIHGKNDPRVPLHEAEQIVDTLRGLGRPVELLVFENEGHGLVRRENQLAAWSRVAEFLTQTIAAGAGSSARAA